ncbi:adhesion G protein-coupled receptor F4 [Perognathus longimembris pacificus]|uniref:adhesion G protein-coupled receptor F4 n=1 Tax=Perognathus longimembris pacificus TaxID=214514 RepID=UPI002018AF11|nr:adhesion G protein-coupled receptor F4 [Perognathus longimembris pacificus]
MKPQAALLCCLVLFPAIESSHSRSTIHLKDGEKLQSPQGDAKPGRTQERCHGPCVSSSTCSQPCAKHFRGHVEFTCHQNKWQKSTETCTSLSVEALFRDSNDASRLSLASSSIPLHLLDFRAPQPIENVTQGIQKNCPLDYSCIVDAVTSSETTSGNIAFIVELLKNISADLSDDVTPEKMESYSELANHILSPDALANWTFLPAARGAGAEELLAAVSAFAGRLRLRGGAPESAVERPFLRARGAALPGAPDAARGRSFAFPADAARPGGRELGSIRLPAAALRALPPGPPSAAVALAFPTLGAVLPGGPDGAVLALALPRGAGEAAPGGPRHVLLTFPEGPGARARCVGWRAPGGRWDPRPCRTLRGGAGRVRCCCEHAGAAMSFSVLLSPRSVAEEALGYVTRAALGASIASLALCLLVEAAVWTRVAASDAARARHVCLVNIAASLLAADLWFLVGAHADIRSHAWCVAVAFLSHLFYLAAFFWMLFKALLLAYGVLVVFRTALPSRVAAAGCAVGYGCPLAIALATVAVTEPRGGYVRCDACWLDWDQSRALLAFAAPVLAIVAVNLLAALAVAVGAQRPALGGAKARLAARALRVGKNVALLTPLLGLTWGFGVATLVDGAPAAFHLVFALLNGLQGFFILLFGTIMDHKIRDALRMRMSSLRRRKGAAANASLSPTNGSRLMNH